MKTVNFVINDIQITDAITLIIGVETGFKISITDETHFTVMIREPIEDLKYQIIKTVGQQMYETMYNQLRNVSQTVVPIIEGQVKHRC